jgi:lipopolysaccharide heptosyltransferase II
VPSTAVIQVKRGIGDVIWHLPLIRAIAAKTPEGAVTFLTPSSTRASELLAAEPGVGAVTYFEHQGSELRRAINLGRLAALLRTGRFRRIWILDRTVRPAFAAWLAGIPERIGPGDRAQRYFLTNAPIEPHHFRELAMDWLRLFVERMGVPVASLEPALNLPQPLLADVERRFQAPRPWLVLALGASHPAKDWSDAQWTGLLAALRPRLSGTLFLIGGPDNAARASTLIARSPGLRMINACDLAIIEAAALLRRADLFVGPDSGPMNLAAAGGTPAFGLFGATPVLRYSRFIHAIEPEGGQTLDGMSRITPEQVLRRIEPYLGVTKVAAAY